MDKVYNLVENSFTQNTTCASIEGKSRSNKAEINIFNTTATLIKSPDNIFVEMDETIPYKLVFNNTQDITVTTLEIIDIMPEGLAFVPNSVKVNGVSTSQNIESGITLTTPVVPRGQVTVTFDAKVISIPPTQYQNKASARFSYYFNQTNTTCETDPIRSKQIESNTVRATAVMGSLAVNKQADVAEIQKNGTMMYTIGVTNTGNVSTQNMAFTDLLPSQVEYVTNTFTRNGVSVPGTIDFVNGIPIGDLEPGKNMTLTFQVRLVDDNVPSVPNTGTAHYEFIKDPTKPAIPRSQESNLIVVPVQRNDVSVTKSANKHTVVEKEPITFTLLVNNEGTVAATDLLLKDLLPIGLKFVEGSIKINDTPTSGDIIDGISLPTLQAGTNTTVTFEAVVLAIPPYQFTNSASLDYSYTINQETFSQKIFSNPVTVFAPFISITKQASQTMLTPGDTSTFTLVVSNKGRRTIDHLSVTDILQAPLKLVPGSIKIDGNLATGDLANLPLPDLASGATTVVTFDVEVSHCNGYEQIINTATLNYTPSSDLSYSITSNPVTIQVECGSCNVCLCAAKCVNTPNARIGEIVTYSIFINNASTQTVENVILSDQLDPRLSFIPSSLTINGQPAQGDIEKLRLESIPVQGSISIIFKAKIMYGCIEEKIDNRASIQYTGCQNSLTTIYTNSAPITIKEQQGCCCCQSSCPSQPPYTPSYQCFCESVLTPIEIPSYMKPIHTIRNVNGFIRNVKPMKYGYNVTKLLVTYVVTLEYCCQQGGVYTHQELEEVCFEVKDYTSRMKVELIDIGEPYKVDCHRVEVIVRMNVCR